MLNLNRTKFYAALKSPQCRMFGGRLSPTQVAGMEGILDAFPVTGDGREKTLAYGLGTARREVGIEMVPVREGFAKSNAGAVAAVTRMFREGKISKNYALPDPKTGFSYYGRGYVQITWLANYQKEGIADNPDKALEPKWAAEAMFRGLLDGRWNGARKGIAFYLPTNGPDDEKNARRTVNVLDHWDEVAANYRQFLTAVRGAL